MTPLHLLSLRLAWSCELYAAAVCRAAGDKEQEREHVAVAVALYLLGREVPRA
jgi:hypothetical protein